MQKSIFKGSSVSNKMIWNIAYSIILGNLAQTIVSLTDTAFLGRLGEVELGASAMSGIYYYFFTTLAWGFAVGVQVIVARRYGESNFGKIGTILGHGFIFVLAFACLMFSVINFLSPVFLRSVITSDNIYRVSIEYLSVRGYGIFFASINFMFRSFYIGISSTKSISYSTLLMAIVNTLLDWALIFGTPFNEAMGVKGAAAASVCAEISATLFFIFYTRITNPIKGYKLFEGFHFDFSILRNILRLSISTTMQKFLSFGSWLVFFFMIESMGERPLAITMVIRSVFMLISIPAFALGATSNTLTSRLIGEGRAKEVLPTIWKVVRMSFIITAPLVLFVAIFPQLCLNVYTDNPEIIVSAIPLVYLICFSAYAFALAMPFFEGVSGTGYTQFALYLEALIIMLYIFAIWFFAKGINAGLIWVWTSEIIYSGSLAIVSILFMKYYKWGKRSV
ncbi:MAG: MATE family efflux transporter [Rikenellaceae bacterium]